MLADEGRDGTRGGLRERKKQATREALTLAAVRLASERGLENVRNEDIAAEAGVSPRTFSNYFSSKYEALAARNIDRARQAADTLRSRPEGEPLWDALIEATLSPLAGAERAHRAPEPDVLARLRRMSDAPALLGEALKTGLAADSELAAAIAERTGTDVDRDLYPRLAAAAVTSAVHVATDRWLRADPPVPLVPLLVQALRQLAAGLPDPSTDPGAAAP
ncbi:TetR family transcriptional regulator [Streptomyces antioxidans]|uniref:TetR family transcriptional regulator n=1 Tax=Streptomyces antioxidans TaxID=1507734 RepID=A0A1V4CVJ1_9ACTN|nr:TetR family transcriptional regulator [Streptomyces antioxidans]OPF71596.1 TetR family transcriptional regulator [Streptomyces antioxidans]